MNKHVFCLKTGIDDFKHSSTKFFTVFLDFRDAFGTLPHDVMFHALDEIRLPQLYADVIKDVYYNSYIQVICGSALTDRIPLQIGIKTGCPWSAINFILAINSWMKWLCQCAPAGVRSPNPVQGYADDVEISSRWKCYFQHAPPHRRVQKVVRFRHQTYKICCILWKEETDGIKQSLINPLPFH